MAVIEDIVKALLLCLFKTVVILLAVFSVISILSRCDLFHAHLVEFGLETAVSILLGLGSVAQVLKRFITPRMNAFKSGNAEFNTVLVATLLLTILSGILSLIIFVWDCVLYGKIQICNMIYFAMLALFLICFCIPPCTLTTYDKHHGRTIAFLRDQFLVALYIGIYIQINFLEAKETLAIYSDDSNCTSTDIHSDQILHSSHDPIVYWHEIFRSAAYAITVEAVALFLVCYWEQKHLQMHAVEEDAGDQRVDLNQYQHLIRSIQEIHTLDYVCFAFGLISVFSTIGAMIGMHILKNIGKQAAKSQDIIVCKTVFFACVLGYTMLLFYCTKAYQVSQKMRNSISSSLDLKLLRWSSYGILLILLLVLSATICGPEMPITQSALNYINYIFNVCQVWIQYSYLSHCLALMKFLKTHQIENWTGKMRLHVLPLAIGNIFFWIYNLWQWKTVAMLALPDQVSPGPVWAVTEAILFPVAIFFRFHSFVLCYVLCQFRRPDWVERIARWYDAGSGDPNPHQIIQEDVV